VSACRLDQTLSGKRVVDLVDGGMGQTEVGREVPNGWQLGPRSLPHRLDRGESAQLVILWVITDCARLIPGQEPQIELTAILGTKRVSGSPTSLARVCTKNPRREGHLLGALTRALGRHLLALCKFPASILRHENALLEERAG